MKIALIGNPNCGKTTLFNALTGGRQHVGNYAGVTVEKKTGDLIIGEKHFEIIDLPGIYGLTAYSSDELVARKYLLEEKPDLIINVIDAGNLERNLYLTIQLMEMGLPLIIALNMEDEAMKDGLKIDATKLSKLLNAPVISTIAHKKKGVDKLRELLGQAAEHYLCPQYQKISYGSDLDETLTELLKFFEDINLKTPYRPLWLALKILENDEEVLKKIYFIVAKENLNKLTRITDKVKKHIEITLKDVPENIICDYRYGFSSSLNKSVLSHLFPQRKNVSYLLDELLLNRVLGPILLLAILFVVYFFAFKLSEYPTSLIENFFEYIKTIASNSLGDGLLKSLIISGVIDGVGGVLTFTPIIVLMFILIAIIEDSGYMARIAFLMDRFLRTFGMHGSSILAYIIAGGMGGGCAVPGILATRTLRDPKEKLATILTTPFMNCGAKLPVFALLIAAFFPHNQGTMLFVITILSWLFALTFAGILRKTLIKGESTPFVMELPPYRFPTFKGLLIHTWERTYSYIQKAGTYILLAAIIIWALMSFPRMEGVGPQTQLENSYAGKIGKTLEPITKPLMGFTWETNIALIGGMSAKEIIISTLSIAHSMNDNEKELSLRERLAKNPNWNRAVAFSLIIFIMLYMPCIATLVTIYRETLSIKWTIFSMVYTTSVAGFFAAISFRLALLL